VEHDKISIETSEVVDSSFRLINPQTTQFVDGSSLNRGKNKNNAINFQVASCE
jgi:hypothetical protein